MIGSHGAAKLAAALLVLAFLSGCGGGRAAKKDTLSKEELVSQAKDLKMRKNYEASREAFQRVFEEAQDNKLRAEALMEVADSFYENHEFQQADFNYRRFLELFPADPAAAKAQYRLGMIYFAQLKPYDRDQTNAKKSIDEFKKVINIYPKSPYTADSRRKINYALNRLARHELYAGKYYYEKKSYKATIRRLEAVLSDYPGFELEEEVFFYLGDSYLKEKRKAEAAEVYRKMAERHPNGKYLKEARLRWPKNLDSAAASSASGGAGTGASTARGESKTEKEQVDANEEGKKGFLGRIGGSLKSITNIFK